jgi:hypothetical protein
MGNEAKTKEIFEKFKKMAKDLDIKVELPKTPVPSLEDMLTPRPVGRFVDFVWWYPPRTTGKVTLHHVMNRRYEPFDFPINVDLGKMKLE